MKIEDTDALVVVDVQNDFCDGGALPVPEAERVVRPLNRLIFKFENIVFTRDWHPFNHCSFSDAPEFRDGSWPEHCVADSPGAEFNGGLHVPSDARIINKGCDPDREAYSGFDNPELLEYLRRKGVRRVFIGGLATDYCVKATALDAVRHGFDTWLLEDACRGITPESSAAAIAEMVRAGVQCCRSENLI